MENKHLVSIVLPVHNGEAFLEDAIISVLNQTYQNFELIIVDDCSVDTSLIIADNFSRKDKRIIVVSNNENKKLPATLNIGHKIAKGDFVTWTSDDNILKFNFIETLLKAIIIEQVDLVYSNYEIINLDSSIKRTHHTGPTEHLFFDNKIGASFLYKKNIFEELRGYDESLYLLEDYDFWLRASKCFRFYHVNDNLYQYRIHSNSLTSKIHNVNSVNKEYEDCVLRMFQKHSDQCSWNKLTSRFLTDNILGNKMDFFKYLENKKDIEKDLLKFNSEMFNNQKVSNGVFLVLRNELINNHCNLKVLFKVLIKERALLLNSSFSKKTTFNYFIKAVFN